MQRPQLTTRVKQDAELVSKLFRSVFYLTRNHFWNGNEIILAAEIISKLFQRHIERVEKYSRAAMSLWNNFEIISGKIIAGGRRQRPIYFFEIIVCHM